MMNKVLDMSTQSSNNKEYTASLLPNALCDGRVVVHEPSLIECVGSGVLWNIITKKKTILL